MAQTYLFRDPEDVWAAVTPPEATEVTHISVKVGRASREVGRLTICSYPRGLLSSGSLSSKDRTTFRLREERLDGIVVRASRCS
jgi:hypothetical protein